MNTSSPITDEMIAKGVAAVRECIAAHKLTDEAIVEAAYRAMRSSAPPVMGMEEMVERFKANLTDLYCIPAHAIDSIIAALEASGYRTMTTNPSSAMLALAERCEQATGPDREMDGEIAVAALGFERDGQCFYDPKTLFDYSLREPEYYDLAGQINELPRYTASVDAAMTLVPEGWRFIRLEHIRRDEPPEVTLLEPGGPGYIQNGRGTAETTYALALCAAALRARAALTALQVTERKT